MLYWGAGGAANVAVVAVPESMDRDADMPCGPACSTYIVIPEPVNANWTAQLFDVEHAA